MPVPQDTQPLQPTTAKERVLQTLAQWLVDGTLEPGERLYDEQLSRYFQVSRTPVREALQVLAEKGLVEILPGRGTRVTPIDLASLRQSYPLLSHLHGYAVRLAFPLVNDEVIRELKARNLELYHCLSTGDQLRTQAADEQFHQVLLDLAANKYLSAFISDLSIHIARTEVHARHKLDKNEQQGSYHEERLQRIGAHNRAHAAAMGIEPYQEHDNQRREPKGNMPKARRSPQREPARFFLHGKLPCP